MWYWHKDRHIYSLMEQNKGLRNNLHIHGQIIFNKDVKTIQWGKDSPFNKCAQEKKMLLRKLDVHMQKKEVGSLPCTIYKN